MNTFSLKNNWHRIISDRPDVKYLPSQWKRKWGIDVVNARMMYNALKQILPSVIIETGTFEGQGCAVMAQALSDAKHRCIIHTIDYDGDPLTEESDAEWLKLRSIREANLNKIREAYPEISIIFHDGDSREILPKLVANGIKWDFFFQDSMHFYEGIKSEWDCLKHVANDKAVAIFDDISLLPKKFNQNGRLFCERFINSTDAEQWNYISTDIGHHQFWIQKK